MQINADALSSVAMLLNVTLLTDFVGHCKFLIRRAMHRCTRIRRKKDSRCLVSQRTSLSCLSDGLAGILNMARTSLGQILMRQWFLRPSLSIPTIGARHDAIECLNRPENVRTAHTMCSNIKGISNVPRILRLLKAGKAGLKEWQGIVKVMSKQTSIAFGADDCGSLLFMRHS